MNLKLQYGWGLYHLYTSAFFLEKLEQTNENIETIVASWRENMLGYLSADIKLEVNCELRGRHNVQGQISEHIFAPNGDYCL